MSSIHANPSARSESVSLAKSAAEDVSNWTRKHSDQTNRWAKGKANGQTAINLQLIRNLAPARVVVSHDCHGQRESSILRRLRHRRQTRGLSQAGHHLRTSVYARSTKFSAEWNRSSGQRIVG
jgi:hypothetical protein